MSLLMTSLTHGDADALGSIKVEVEERETDRHTERDRVPSIFHSTASDQGCIMSMFRRMVAC